MSNLRASAVFALLFGLAMSRVHAALPEFPQLVKDVGPSVVNISTT
jgi:hypothetical protein